MSHTFDEQIDYDYNNAPRSAEADETLMSASRLNFPMESIRFTYVCRDDDGNITSRTEHFFQGDYITHGEAAENFNQFLRGAGYVLPDGEEYALALVQ